jgi:hypothetical protein
MKWVVLISSNFINASDYAGGFVGRRGMVKFKPEKNWSKGQTTIYKTLHRKLKIEQHESH